jgi:hypothetical protein
VSVPRPRETEGGPRAEVRRARPSIGDGRDLEASKGSQPSHRRRKVVKLAECPPRSGHAPHADRRINRPGEHEAPTRPRLDEARIGTRSPCPVAAMDRAVTPDGLALLHERPSQRSGLGSRLTLPCSRRATQAPISTIPYSSPRRPRDHLGSPNVPGPRHLSQRAGTLRPRVPSIRNPPTTRHARRPERTIRPVNG